MLYFKSYTIYSLQESVMIPILISHILRTNLRGLDNLFMDKGKIYTFLNPVSYLMALDRKDLFGQFDGIFADGSILVAAIRLLYGITVKRRSFDMTSMAPELFRFAENNGKMLYIVASKQEQVEKAVEIFKERYPKLKFMGCRNGYFVSEQEMDAEAKHITQVNPDFLIVGMGALMQERFLLKVRNAGFQGIGFTCGGFIHQTANNEIEYYPLWIDRMNLRFVYRMYKEKHTQEKIAMYNSFLAFLCLCFCTVLKGQALYGTSGLLHMPTADMQKDKTVMLGGNVLDKHPLSTYWNNKNYTYTYNYYINVTIFPWLEVAYTCTLVKGVKGNYWPEQTWGKFRNQDRNFSGRLRLWKEGWWKEWTPQLVLGANDPGSFDNNGGGNINFNQEAGTHNYFNRFFLAATKHLYFQNVGELGLHMAYIYSRATGLNYEGPALGVNFRCCLPDTSLGNKILNGLNLMAEYDARTINIGFNYAVWKDRFNLIAELNDGKYLSAGLYFKICLK